VDYDPPREAPVTRSRKPALLWGRVAIKETLPEAVETIERAYDFGAHPYFRWAADPATTRDEFRASQVPFRFAVEAFSQSLAAVLAHMPRLEERLQVAANVAEEHGHGDPRVSHKHTFLDYLRALGATPEELDGPCPIWVTAFNHSLRDLCLAQGHEVGAAALGIIEHLYVGISGRIARLLQARGWAPPGAQRHYELHEELDVAHARELLALAAPAWDTPRTRAHVALGLLLGAYWFWTLYEDLRVDSAP
jgi:pyrroloquinoline-quinone synthase